MDRLTHKRANGIKTGYWSPNTKEELVQRLAEYENTGLTAEELGCINRGDCDCDHDQICACLGIVRRRFADLEAQLAAGPWIPTTERLPQIGQRVIICRQKEKGVPYIEQATLEVGGWWRVYGTNCKKVDFWMPMPNAPEYKEYKA